MSGRKAETLACLYLKKKGFSIQSRNYTYRGAEIDIIARYKSLIVFVEVKSKSNDKFGSPEEAVTVYKQKQIKKAALAYLTANQKEDFYYRFDVISITYRQKPLTKHIENAF